MLRLKNKHAVAQSLRLLVLSCAYCFSVFLNVAYASEGIGTITELSGSFMVLKHNGTPKILGLNSNIETGDTLMTPKASFARVKFIDSTEITLKPNSTIVIEKFLFNPVDSNKHSVVFNLEKGGFSLRAAQENGLNKTSLLLKRSYAELILSGASGYISIEEATQQRLAALQAYLMASTANDEMGLPENDDSRRFPGIVPLPRLAQNSAGQNAGLAPGLYVHVIDGLIQLSNRGGVQQFAAGQFGFTGSVVQPPVIVPNNPGIQFNPPPAFSSSSSQQAADKSKQKPSVDCEVR